jgi:hypothetical protein
MQTVAMISDHIEEKRVILQVWMLLEQPVAPPIRQRNAYNHHPAQVPA